MIASLIRLIARPDSAKSRPDRTPRLPALDEAFYPFVWKDKVFANSQALFDDVLEASLNVSLDDKLRVPVFGDPILNLPTAKDFADALLANQTYQDWINFTVFGRYVQRSFSAFQRQTEDSFNADMPELLRHELMRHTQALPLGQVLFVAGKLPSSVRREKLITATLNPVQAINDAVKLSSDSPTKKPSSKRLTAEPVSPTAANILTIHSDSVLGFAVKPNKHTSEKTRCEVMLLDFNELRLVDENVVLGEQDSFVEQSSHETKICVRHYSLK